MTQISNLEQAWRSDGFMADALMSAMLIVAGLLTLTFFAAV